MGDMVQNKGTFLWITVYDLLLKVTSTTAICHDYTALKTILQFLSVMN